jgi:hypothetical protein
MLFNKQILHYFICAVKQIIKRIIKATDHATDHATDRGEIDPVLRSSTLWLTPPQFTGAKHAGTRRFRKIL